ncbi:hypothetical protein [Vibrio splendidus]|uniref:hypothetical protein n=1 Tax=Vibrio splendidus TaxID=29497 RepID=UPI0021B3C48C|nr:hypothetical protein [Vibrio splendidus]UWZ98598.1 hypothetical protein IM698_04375 [Vibrio splendidus]
MKIYTINVSLLFVFIFSASFIGYNHFHWVENYKIVPGEYISKNIGTISNKSCSNWVSSETNVSFTYDTIIYKSKVIMDDCSLVPVYLAFKFKQKYLAKYLDVSEMLDFSIEGNDNLRRSVINKLLGDISLGNFKVDIVKNGGEIVCFRSLNFGVVCLGKIKDT